jgi:hypothetical protein
MAMTSRNVWLMISVLAVVNTVGVGRLLNSWLRVSGAEVVFLPIQDWRLGVEPIEIDVCTFPGSQAILVGERGSSGPLRVTWLNRLGRAWRDDLSGR